MTSTPTPSIADPSDLVFPKIKMITIEITYTTRVYKKVQFN